MDCVKEENEQKVEQEQSLSRTNPEIYVPWSPSNEFFGQEFNTSTPLSPNELTRFCNALTSEVDWTQDAFKSPRIGAPLSAGQEKNTESIEDLKRLEQRSILQKRIGLIVYRELTQVKTELASLRQDMEAVRNWMFQVEKWSESINHVWDSFESQKAEQSTCVEPGCTCQWQGDKEGS